LLVLEVLVLELVHFAVVMWFLALLLGLHLHLAFPLLHCW